VYSLEHCLDRHDRVAVGERVLLGGIGEFFVDDDHVLRQSDSGPEEVVQTGNVHV
jgi:hypothetical protein